MCVLRRFLVETLVCFFVCLFLFFFKVYLLLSENKLRGREREGGGLALNVVKGERRRKQRVYEDARGG